MGLSMHVCNTEGNGASGEAELLLFAAINELWIDSEEDKLEGDIPVELEGGVDGEEDGRKFRTL